MQLTDDLLISVADIRAIFHLGRTAAYELTRRPDFPAVVRVSPRCYRWWASEVSAFAEGLRSEPVPNGSAASSRTPEHRQQAPSPEAEPRRIMGRVRPARARVEAR